MLCYFQYFLKYRIATGFPLIFHPEGSKTLSNLCCLQYVAFRNGALSAAQIPRTHVMELDGHIVLYVAIRSTNRIRHLRAVITYNPK